MPKNCYMCDEESTSLEHVPPKCIFPKQKDLASGQDLRKKLITVPSCEAHNTVRSKDDEYLLYALPPSLGSNTTGIDLFLSKVSRAIKDRPTLANNLISQAKSVLVHDTESDEWFTVPALPFDVQRINRVLEMNARAIYFHHHGTQFKGALRVYKNFFLSLEDPSINKLMENVFMFSEQFLAEVIPLGENPSVFTYRFARNEKMELIEFCYYGRNKALVVLNHA